MTFEWGYKRAFLRCALLFVVGTTLQLTVGDIDTSLLRYPWGLILAVNYLYLLVVAYALRNRWRWLRQLGDDKACLSSLAAFGAMVIVFGLTRQDPAREGVVGALGFSRMTSSWPFNLLLLYFMTTLGIRTVSDIHHLRRRRPAAVLTHLGVFVLLAAGTFGSGDTVRCMVTARVGMPVNIGRDDAGHEVQLPFALTLDDFSIEEYPPKLYLLDTRRESSSREFLSVEADGAEAVIDGWRIRAEHSLDMAGRLPEESDWRAMKHVGAAPAVYVSAENTVTGERFKGWVSCGSHIFEPSYLMLDGGMAVAMPRREAKRYLSRVNIMEEEGIRRDVEIEVNHPARVGSWRVYQVGYDTSKGRWSDTSVLECIRDPWYAAAHVALWMLLAAGVVMFVTAGGRRIGGRERCDGMPAAGGEVSACGTDAGGRTAETVSEGAAVRRRGGRKEVKR